MDCLAIVATLCFTQPAQISTDPPDTVLTSATARVGRATVRLVLSSDNIVDYDPRRMASACAAGRCIAYHRWCADGAGAVTCTFTFGNSVHVAPLTISAPDRAAMAAAIGAIGLLDPTGRQATIPLALLDRQAAEEYAPARRRAEGKHG